MFLELFVLFLPRYKKLVVRKTSQTRSFAPLDARVDTVFEVCIAVAEVFVVYVNTLRKRTHSVI